MHIYARQFALILLALGTLMFAQSFETLRASPIATRVSEYKLANGLQLSWSCPTTARRW